MTKKQKKVFYSSFPLFTNQVQLKWASSFLIARNFQMIAHKGEQLSMKYNLVFSELNLHSNKFSQLLHRFLKKVPTNKNYSG